MKRSRSKKSKYRQKYLLPMIALIALTLFGASYYMLNHGGGGVKPETGQPKIDLQPASETDKKEVDAHKQTLPSQNANPSNSSTPPSSVPAATKKSVTPTIISASQSGIKGFVVGIFEDGGICTATFTQGSNSFSKQSQGYQNASYTSCAPINLTSSDFSSLGVWKVVLSYSSSGAEGTSQAQDITVQ